MKSHQEEYDEDPDEIEMLKLVFFVLYLDSSVLFCFVFCMRKHLWHTYFLPNRKSQLSLKFPKNTRWVCLVRSNHSRGIVDGRVQHSQTESSLIRAKRPRTNQKPHLMSTCLRLPRYVCNFSTVKVLMGKTIWYWFLSDSDSNCLIRARMEYKMAWRAKLLVGYV